MAMVRDLIATLASLFLLAGPSLARDCHPATKAKLASVEASQSDRDMLCAGMGMLNGSSEDSFTVRDHANMVSTAQRLRRAGYKSLTMLLELIPIAGTRPSSDLELVANAYISSSGCVTPELVVRDMGEAVKRGKKGVALKMFKSWDRNGFTVYLAMVGADNACTFR